MPDPTPETPPPAPDGPPSGRQRLRAALTRPSRTQTIAAILLAVVGFAAVTQIRAYQADDTYSGYSEQALIDVLNGLAGTSQRAQAEITRLERTKAQLESATNARQAALDQARERADVLDILAGTVAVNGPGLRITITEVDGTVELDSLLDTVQELRSAGAEAMQFNGKVRVVASTSFEHGPGGIYVDDTLLAPPYVVDVIGEPATLHGALQFVDGPISQLEDDGATVEVVELQSIDIESVRPATRTEYAEPVTQP